MAKLLIGTSGWTYSHWKGIFYPPDLPARERLHFYAQHFPTTEVNYSFYHLPRPATYQKWYRQTPPGFVFSIKASRVITHIRRLKEVAEAWGKFLAGALTLKEKLGPVLLQFPPSFAAGEEEKKRLEEFLALATSVGTQPLRLALEFRHATWCSEATYELLRRYNAAWVIADSSRYPKAKTVTASFVYVRLHGPGTLFSSPYNAAQLEELARDVRCWLASGLDVYVYFNNDFHGYALKNARELMENCGIARGE